MRSSRSTAAAALCVATMMAFTGNLAGAQTTGEPPVPCADSDLVATDSAMLNRQLSVACSHIESERAWQRAGELFHGYNGTRVDWPAALAEYRRLIRLTEGHAPGTLGYRRWRFAITRAAQVLSFGGRGVTRDLAEARRLAESTGVDQAWVARLEQAMIAHAEADKPTPRPALRPGLWRTSLVEDDGGTPDEDTHCILQDEIDEIMDEGPDRRAPCHWLSLSRSPTHFEGSWICEDLETGPYGQTTLREQTTVKATMSADRLQFQSTTTRQYLNFGGPTTTREEGSATRLGDC